MNNTHKQSKTGLREEGVNPTKVSDDRLYFLKDGQYVPFSHRNWDSLVSKQARL
jgi:hypothetical protein